MKDRHKKGRYKQPSGEDHHAARYTEEQVRYIRSCGRKSRDLAIEFDCNYTYIDQIKRGDAWRNLK